MREKGSKRFVCFEDIHPANRWVVLLQNPDCECDYTVWSFETEKEARKQADKSGGWVLLCLAEYVEEYGRVFSEKGSVR